jgi:hypothetical protein
LSFDSFCYNRDPSMKNTEYRTIIRLVFLEMDTGTTIEANEPIEVDDDVSHEASENKEQGKFQSRWAGLYTWLTYDKDKNKMCCSKCISIGANNTITASRIAHNCLNC